MTRIQYRRVQLHLFPFNYFDLRTLYTVRMHSPDRYQSTVDTKLSSSVTHTHAWTITVSVYITYCSSGLQVFQEMDV